jgi:3-oxoacyl-[acyl-carrier protein] reductase
VTDIRLDGKVAVVTGATGGWGSGAAIALADRGAKVVLNSRTQAKLDVLVARVRDRGGEAVGVAQDVSDLAGATRLVERAVDQYGRLDVLVNSAGMRSADGPPDQGGKTLGLYGGDLLDLPEDTWSFTIAAELTMIYACTKAAVTRMVAQADGGSVITVIGNILGQPGQSAHAAAKSAVLGCVWSWSDELKQYGITVNGVRGYVRSLLTDPAFDVADYDFDAGRGQGTLPTEPLDAGQIVAWLASGEAADVTGAYLGLDGPRVTVWEPKLPDTSVFRDSGWTADDLERSLGPIVRRRPRRPGMSDQLMELFNARDRERASRSRDEYTADEES